MHMMHLHRWLKYVRDLSREHDGGEHEHGDCR